MSKTDLEVARPIRLVELSSLPIVTAGFFTIIWGLWAKLYTLDTNTPERKSDSNTSKFT